MIAKKRGRPATGINPIVSVRMPADLLDGLEAAIDAQGEPKPGRPEMVRRMVADWLRERGFFKA